MARRYSRDNRGRFASAGSGATARGGRLKTAAGNKRAMQTAKVSGGRPAGTMKGKVKRDAGAMSKAGQSKAAAPSKKRVLVRMDARPQNLFSRTSRKSDGYGTDAKANVANARKQIERAGATSALKSNKRSNTVASVNERSPKQVDINASHTAWRNPRKDMIQSRRKNEFSTTSPGHYVAHELGHVRHPSSKMARSWDVQLRGKGQVYADASKVVSAKRMARRVSKYAMTQPAEFAAETRAARSLGKKYDSKVMGLYRNVTGTKLPSLKSQQQKKGANSGFVSPRAKTAKPAATPKPSAAKPAKAIKATQQQRNIREFMDQKRGAVARDYKNDAQAFRLPLAKKDQVAGGPRTVGGALEALTTKSYKKTTSKSSLTSSEIAKAQKLITDNNIKGYKVVKNEYGYSLLRNSGVSAKAAKLAEAAITRKAARKPAAAANRKPKPKF